MDKIFKITGFINYLIVVFFNAFTDLGHKIIIQDTIFKVYSGSLQIILAAVVNALVLLPFVLLFSPSGFLSDRFKKNIIMRDAAFFAVVITLLITLFYYLGWFYAAFGMTFLLALQSALYSPAKYGYIKELVGDKNLSAANGAVQAVTTVAILSGIIFYTVLFELFLQDRFHNEADVLRHIAPLGWLLVVGSLIEWYLAAKLPDKQLAQTKKVFDFKKYIKGYYLYKNLKLLRRKKEIWENVLALSLFWSISQVILAIFGEYAKSHLHITNTVYVQGSMALAGIGIVLGSILAAKLSRFYINPGIAMVGAVGITVIVFSIPHLGSIGIIIPLFMLFGVFSGFILVPLSANIQHLAPNVHLGTILAGNNFIQNIFMIFFLMLTTFFAYFGMDAQMLFVLMGFVGIGLFYLLARRYIVDFIWSMFELLAAVRYRIEYDGLEHIPASQAVLLLGNHVSWLDWLFLQLPIQRRIYFMMDKEIYHWKIFHWLLRHGNIIPLSPRAFKDAMRTAAKRLRARDVVAIFPEGEISKDCKLGKFHKGFELIEKEGWEGVLVPFYIEGMEGSLFARCKKGMKFPFPRRRVKVCFFEPLPKTITAEELQTIIEGKKEQC